MLHERLTKRVALEITKSAPTTSTRMFVTKQRPSRSPAEVTMPGS